MKITVIGAGAMGGSYGGLLSVAGHEVSLIDTWADHVEAINRDGLLVDGALGTHRVTLPASLMPGDQASADIVIIFVDSNNTRAAAESAAKALSADGFAITFQNGIGNVEILQEVLGADRLLGGSSMCSAASNGPGHVSLTHMGLTSVGEIGKPASDRAAMVIEALKGAGFEAGPEPDVIGTIWQKFVINCGGNAIAAVTGLRSAEVRRQPDVAAFQKKILAEVMQVLDAKGITLPDPDIAAKMTAGLGTRFNRPSMLQHVDAGRKTEIDALNGALLREAEKLGLSLPYNEALVALLKGREQARMRAVGDPDLDYEAWEARAIAGEE